MAKQGDGLPKNKKKLENFFLILSKISFISWYYAAYLSEICYLKLIHSGTKVTEKEKCLTLTKTVCTETTGIFFFSSSNIFGY